MPKCRENWDRKCCDCCVGPINWAKIALTIKYRKIQKNGRPHNLFSVLFPIPSPVWSSHRASLWPPKSCRKAGRPLASQEGRPAGYYPAIKIWLRFILIDCLLLILHMLCTKLQHLMVGRSVGLDWITSSVRPLYIILRIILLHIKRCKKRNGIKIDVGHIISADFGRV